MTNRDHINCILKAFLSPTPKKSPDCWGHTINIYTVGAWCYLMWVTDYISCIHTCLNNQTFVCLYTTEDVPRLDYLLEVSTLLYRQLK